MAKTLVESIFNEVFSNIKKMGIIFEEEDQKEDSNDNDEGFIKDSNGKYWVKKKGGSGQAYQVKKYNTEKHDPVDKASIEKAKAKEREKSGAKKRGRKKKIVQAPVSREVRTEVRKQLEAKVEKNGQKLQYRKVMGRTYVMGIDKTGTKNVYDWDGKSYAIDDFVEMEKERRKELDKLNRIHKLDTYLEGVKQLNDAQLSALAGKNLIQNKMITDNKSLKNRVTRNYPCVEDDKGNFVIVEGRFKGYYLDDMINRTGRQVAGTAYSINPETGRAEQIETKKNGVDALRVRHEPYVSLNEHGQMHVTIPQNDKVVNRKLANLAKSLKSLQKGDGKSWSFQLSDYDLVQEAIGGFVMSEQASKHVQADLEAKREASKKDNDATYDHISTNKIEGFKKHRGFPEKDPTNSWKPYDENDGYEFNSAQKKAIGWGTKKGYGQGKLIGLGTGVGKTGTAIGMFMQWKNDGTLSQDGKNGKALFVVPPSLRGNIEGSFPEWLENPTEARKSCDTISYNEFMKNPKKYSQYGAIFFDEAQAMKNIDTKASQSAFSFDHPRKVPLTASVMEKTPLDLFNMIELSKGKSMSRKEIRAKKRKFIRTYCETVGNKVMGLKSDPKVLEQFKKYIKANCVYVDKQDVKEQPLPSATPPQEQTVSITMDGEIKDAYEKLARPIRSTLKRMAKKFQEGKLAQSELNQELSRTMGQIQKLRYFSNNPDEFVEGLENPKVKFLKDYVREAYMKNNDSKTVTFTDNPELAEKSAREVSKEFPTKLHVVALHDQIKVYKGGEVVKKLNKSSKFYDRTGKIAPKDQWQTYAIKSLKGEDVGTFNMTKAYTTGHNMQFCNNVVHLDRDTWNARNMEQREARVWRTGQTGHVDMKIVDLALDDGSSMNEIEKYSMNIENKLFDEVVKGAENVTLDEYDPNVDVKELIKNKEALEYALSPTFAQRNKLKGLTPAITNNPEDQQEWTKADVARIENDIKTDNEETDNNIRQAVKDNPALKDKLGVN